MRIINTAEHTPTDTLGQLALYSGMDNLTLYEIADGISSFLAPNKLQVYRFELALHSALLEMAKNGLHIDIPKRDALIREYEATEKKLNAYLHDLCTAIGYYDFFLQVARIRFANGEALDEIPTSWAEWLALPIQVRRSHKLRDPKGLAIFQKALKEFAEPFNGNSSQQKLRLFFAFFGHEGNSIYQDLLGDFLPVWNKARGISEIKTRSLSGDYTPGADRDVLERLQKKALEATEIDAVFWAQPFISCCLALADVSKTLSFLRCKLEAGMFKYSFGAVTETGRLNSKANAQGFGSNAQNVAPKNRVIFTCPIGWKLIAIDFSQIESRNVAAICFSLFGAVRYLAAVDSGDAHSLTCALVWPNEGWPEEFTIDHCIKYGAFPEDILNAAKKVASKEFYRGKTLRDASKTLGHGCLTEDHEVLTPDGWVSISEKPPVIMQWPGEFVPVSNWTDKLYTGTMFEWEGQSLSVNMTADHRVYYSTTNENSITVKPAALVPRTGKVMLGNRYIGGQVDEPLARLLAAYHCDGSWEGYHQVKFHFHKARKINRLKELAEKAGITFVEYEDPTRFALNWHPTLHAPSWSMLQWNKASLHAYMDELKYWDGHVGATVISLHSKHRRWLECWQTFNRLLGKGGNIQKPKMSGFGTTMFCLQENNRVLANRTSFTKDFSYEVENLQVFCPTVQSQAFYIRRNGKISVTGNSNYLGQPPTMSKHSHIPVKLIEHYQAAYFEAFPELKQWHQYVATQIQTTQKLTTLFGRERQFFGRPIDDATIREAVAYEPQSMAADYCNRALLDLHQAELEGKGKFVLSVQKHDELIARFREEDEQEVVQQFTRIMERHLTLISPSGETRDWFVPAEAETGWNLGRRMKNKKTGEIINPDGLSHPDHTRVRAENPFNLLGHML